MKTITTTILLFLVLSAVAQEQYDVRKTKWGMAISEVMASEYPLTPSETKVDELKYSYVELSNGHKATILYSFTNAKLTEVRYIMYGYNAEFSRGTCTNIIPLYDKIKYTNFVFEALKSKGMKCDMGWYLVNCSNVKTKSSFDPPCNSDFYNTYYWLVFTPSYKLKNEMKKGDF
jgi:hypothetical protein